jgi:hypothetical protein
MFIKSETKTFEVDSEFSEFADVPDTPHINDDILEALVNFYNDYSKLDGKMKAYVNNEIINPNNNILEFIKPVQELPKNIRIGLFITASDWHIPSLINVLCYITGVEISKTL